MRALAILAVSAVLGQHALTLVHALTVEHVRCAEHGELLDLAQSGAPVGLDPGMSEAPDHRAENHDHCAVDWLAQLVLGAPTPAIEAHPIAPAIASVSLAPADRSIELLAIAPKTSPPIA